MDKFKSLKRRDKIIIGSVVAGGVIFSGYALSNADKDKIPSTAAAITTTTAIVETIADTQTQASTLDAITEAITSIAGTEAVVTVHEAEKTKPNNIEPPEISNVITTSKPLEIVTQAPPKANTVYIAATGNGKKFHANPNCSGMAGNVIEMTKDQAYAAGYTPCQKNTCYG